MKLYQLWYVYSVLLGCTSLCFFIFIHAQKYHLVSILYFGFLLWNTFILFYPFLFYLAVFAQLLSFLSSTAVTHARLCVYVCTCVSIRSDVRLHKDDVDICFSKTLNSCKVPQIRYASVERLLERLTDLRFLSIDFLNTFLHTYRIFTTATVVMDKLADIYKKPFSSIPIRSINANTSMCIHEHRKRVVHLLFFCIPL